MTKRTFKSLVPSIAVIVFTVLASVTPAAADSVFDTWITSESYGPIESGVPKPKLSWTDFETETNLFVVGEISLEVNPGSAWNGASMDTGMVEPIVIKKEIKSEGQKQRNLSHGVANPNFKIELFLTYLTSILGAALTFQFLLSYGSAVIAVCMMGAMGVIFLVKNGRRRASLFITSGSVIQGFGA